MLPSKLISIAASAYPNLEYSCQQQVTVQWKIIQFGFMWEHLMKKKLKTVYINWYININCDIFIHVCLFQINIKWICCHIILVAINLNQLNICKWSEGYDTGHEHALEKIKRSLDKTSKSYPRVSFQNFVVSKSHVINIHKGTCTDWQSRISTCPTPRWGKYDSCVSFTA